MNCPECGASEALCKTCFDEFLVLEFTKTLWAKTILEGHTENAKSYCTGVTAWTRSVSDDAKEIEI
jgi:hypothetical protein